MTKVTGSYLSQEKKGLQFTKGVYDYFFPHCLVIVFLFLQRDKTKVNLTKGQLNTGLNGARTN